MGFPVEDGRNIQFRMSAGMYLLYTALLAVLLVLGLPFWLLQMLRHGKYRAGLGERLGRVPSRILAAQSGPLIWIHAVSVGEVLAVAGLAGKLREEYPSHRIVVSTTTAAGQKLARSRFGEQNVFYFPLDFAFCVRPYLRALRPQLIVLAETEFWPNFLRLARKSGAKVAVVNARISDRSLPGYLRVRRWLSRVLENVELLLAQTSEDRERLIAIGAPPDRTRVAGNLKFDVPPAAETDLVTGLREMFARSGFGPIFVCGSTMEGEESLLLRGFENVLASHPNAVMVLAPRHPERFDKVANLLDRLHTKFWRRSQWRGEPISGGVLLLDSIGELASVYSLADVAFVGGSLVSHGGHNILEPAQFGVAIVTGISYQNFRDIVQLFEKNQAVRIVGAAELPLVFMELVNSPEVRKALGQNALRTLRQESGATEVTLKALAGLLPRSAN
jgi:3-deoxy-D-manno-octulosonic-acid transferase